MHSNLAHARKHQEQMLNSGGSSSQVTALGVKKYIHTSGAVATATNSMSPTAAATTTKESNARLGSSLVTKKPEPIVITTTKDNSKVVTPTQPKTSVQSSSNPNSFAQNHNTDTITSPSFSYMQEFFPEVTKSMLKIPSSRPQSSTPNASTVSDASSAVKSAAAPATCVTNTCINENQIFLSRERVEPPDRRFSAGASSSSASASYTVASVSSNKGLNSNHSVEVHV